jgi:hypothetical protein
MRYLIERVDTSSCWIEADSEDDAVLKSNDDGNCWDICVGDPQCVEVDQN